MVTLSHLLSGREMRAGAEVYDLCGFGSCGVRWFDAAASPPSGQGVIESGAVISVDEVARCLTNGSRAATPIPASSAVCLGGSLLATSSWVGHNSSSYGDRALSQSPSAGLPLACSVLGKRFSGAPVCEL